MEKPPTSLNLMLSFLHTSRPSPYRDKRAIVIIEGYPSRQEGQAMLKFITVFLQEESGATVVEYAILASLIGIVAIATILLAGGEVRNLFEGAQTSISDATG